MRYLPFLLLLLSACVTFKDSVVRHASQVEACPEKQVEFISLSKDQRIAEVKACGKFRRYQDMTSYGNIPQDPNWVDVTPK